MPSIRNLSAPLVVLAVTLPARFILMDQSLWADEAWVANSILADSWREMFAGTTWVQSTPPLFLIFERVLTGALGASERVLRIWPWIASALAVPIFYLALSRLFTRTSALLGATLLATNYWSIKMGQQVKQYSGDLLVSALFLWALSSLGSKQRPRTGVLIALAIAGPWLSAPWHFLLPAAVAGIALRYRRGVEPQHAVAFAVTAAISAALNYVLVARPAMARSLTIFWSPHQLSLSDPVSTLAAFGRNVAHLFLPPLSAPVVYASYLIVGCAVAGAALQLHFVLRRPAQRERAILLLAGGAVPVAACMAASFAGIYPVLTYPRMILWMLPCLALLAISLFDPLIARWESLAGRWTLALCLAAAAAVQILLIRSPRPAEHNRQAVEAMERQSQSGDVIYVHGGVSEAFTYYTRLLGWKPPHVYLGNADWPCCPLDRGARVTNPDVRDFGDELMLAAGAARGHRLWIFSPSGVDGHWSVELKASLDAGPRRLIDSGCAEAVRQPYDQSRLLAFDCR